MSKLSQALYPFQQGDLEFLKAHPRCINGNPMGAGKTEEALALIEGLGTRHNLIVCKKRFIPEWFWRIDKWLDGDCLTPHENGDRLIGLDLEGPRFVAVNYDMLAIPRYWAALQKVKWDCIVFDECHKIKNHEAKRTRYSYLLSTSVPHIVLMSGTPMPKGPADLYPLFHIIDPRKYNSYQNWTDYFCVKVTEEIWVKDSKGIPRPRIIRQIVPGINHETELRALLSLYMVRHEREEYMPQLPPKQHRIVPVELGSEMTQYKQMEDDFLALLDSGEEIYSPTVVAQMTRLRQICLDPNLLGRERGPSTPSAKTQALLELLEDMEGKVVVFSFFEGYIAMLSKVLNEVKVKHVVMTGKTKYEGQDKQFQSNPEIKVCLGTIGTMGESYTLSAADTVIFTDLLWNPSDNEQAEDRVYGRVDRGLEGGRSTLIIDLYCQGTVEDHVHKIVRAKERMIEAVVTRRVVDSIRATKARQQ